VAAAFETVEIELGGFFWITWVPFVALIVAVLWLNRRLSRIRREESAKSMAVAPAIEPGGQSPV
jgi:hypothetical protein